MMKVFTNAPNTAICCALSAIYLKIEVIKCTYTWCR